MSKSCFIVAGGESLKDFNFTKLTNKNTIVVNKAVFHVPNSTYFITTDYTFINWMRKNNLYSLWKRQPCKKIFVANCIAPFMKFNHGKITDTRYNLTYKLNNFNQVIVCTSAKDVGFDFDHFNSGYNSGFSAFQYAVIMGFNPIYLLGMDMQSGKYTHYHGGYGKSKERFEKNLSAYYPHFVEVLKKLKKLRPKLKIISCSDTSKLNEFIEYKNIDEVLK